MSDMEPGYYNNSPMNVYGSSIVALTDPDGELIKLEHTLRNTYENEEGNLIYIGDALLNDLGINSVLGIVRSVVNRVTVMSNLDKEIGLLIDFLGDTLAKDLMQNRKRYHIVDNSARDKIFCVCLNTAYICMRRAYQEGDRRFWKGSQQDIRTTVVDDKEKSGFLSRLWGN